MNASATTLLRIFIPFALGYFLSYLFRTVNAVIAPNLASDVGVDPASLGLLTSAYFLSFAAFQLPLGVLLDKYGPRRVEAILRAATAPRGPVPWHSVPRGFALTRSRRDALPRPSPRPCPVGS